MKKKYLIFDMDGTLVDSMGVWHELAAMNLGDEIMPAMAERYRTSIPFKEGAKECLLKWKAEGARMCVLSMTPKYMMEACLERLGVTDLVEFILSCREIGIFKENPNAYHMVVRMLGGTPEETAVFEDALYAAKTAKEAGYYVVGIYDKDGADEWQEMQKIAHEAHINWKEML